MKTKINLTALLLSLIFSAFGQKNAVIDSLENVLKNAKADTAKVHCLNELSSEYLKITDYKMSLQYAESALELAKTLDYKKGIMSISITRILFLLIGLLLFYI